MKNLLYLVLFLVGIGVLFVALQMFFEKPPVRTTNQYLEVDNPIPYQEIGNPVLVSGRSNFFEANTRIRIKDDMGTILIDTFATAEGWMTGLFPFNVLVSFKEPKTSRGTVEIFEQSAEDSSERRKITIPVHFR